jgi:RNA polymerase sigma factor, sigma-70 family
MLCDFFLLFPSNRSKQIKMIDDKLTNEFLNVIEENKKLIYKVSCIYCDSTIDKDDLFQEIIANLWKAYPEFKGNSKISSWIYKIAFNTAISWFRDYIKHKGRIEYGNLIPNVSNDSELEDVCDQLYSAIEHLGKIDKAIIILQLEGYSYDDISEMIGLTKTNVATKINRIKLKLKNHLSNN